jgi:threonine dehydratase
VFIASWGEACRRLFCVSIKDIYHFLGKCMESAFTITEIWKARSRIKPFVLRTPLIYSDALSIRLGCSIYLKMECWQKCGCFKVRGAINKIASLSENERKSGLVTASSGNHAIATAYAAGLFGALPTTVFMPERADPTKVEKVKAYGVNLVLNGQDYFEAYDKAHDYCRQAEATYIHSHDDPQVIAGQGTVGLEIMEDLPDVDAVMIPIGGGGLISGVSSAVKMVSPSTRIIGVEPAAAPSAFMSLRDGKCYDRIELKPSIADGLLGGIGQLTFEIMRQLVEQVVVLEEDEIGRGVAAYQKKEQLMVEAASAVGLAALLSGKVNLKGKKVVLVITSRNIDSSKFNQLINKFG